MEAGTTALHPVAAEAAIPGAQGGAEASSRKRRRSGSRLPATRELARTLHAVLALTGVATAIGLVVGGGIAAAFALAAAGLGGAVAGALWRAISVLTPPTLRVPVLGTPRSLRVATVGAAAAAAGFRAELEGAGVERVEVVGAIAPDATEWRSDGPELGVLRDVHEIVDRHSIDVLLIGPGVARTRVVDTVLRQCEDQEVRLCALAAFSEEIFGCVPILETDGSWLQCVLHPRYRSRRSKRIFDLTVAALLAVLCLPLLGVLALLVRRDGGPALYRQRRVGRDGRTFVIYKLRTMRWESMAGPARWAEDGDARITSLGRVLRRTHVDELPQLVNVLRGEMSLVGPRPEQPEIAARLDAAMPLWRGRHRHKPGLTGWAQVRCGYGGSDDGSAVKLAHDLYYLRRRSLALDVAILAQTGFTIATAGRLVEPSTGPYVLPHAPEAPAPVDVGTVTEVDDHVDVMPVRALVTGGAGFIGSRLVDELVAAGNDVVVVDDLSSGRAERLTHALASGARLHVADVTDAAAMERLFAAVRPQVVFHLAAQIEVSRAVADPLADATANVVGTLVVLEAARTSSVRRFVLASSGGAIYGDAAEMPTAEDALAVPLSPYGAAKLAAEHYTALYGRLHGISTMTLRLANVYGPGQGDGGEGGVVARFCRARLDGSAAAVFGDGGQTRDYVHVRDVVAAFVAAGHSSATGALNVGTGTETTVLDLVRELGLQPEFRAPRPGEVRRSCLDASAAKRMLGWAAETPLDEGLAETLAYARAMPGKSLTSALQVVPAPPIEEACAVAGSPAPPARSRFSRWPRPQRRTVARSTPAGTPPPAT